MGRNRIFDHEVACAMRADGLTLEVIARALGVSEQSIRYATSPAHREHAKQRQRELRLWIGTCSGCGGPATKYRAALCRACSAKARTESVRDDTLRCCACHEWKPDDQFASRSSAAYRRFRTPECRPCVNERKRVERANWTPEQAAYHAERDRERHRARRRRDARRVEFIVVEPEPPAKPAREKGTKSGKVTAFGYHVRPEHMRVSVFTPWVSTCRPELGIALPEPHRSEWQLAMAEWRAEG